MIRGKTRNIIENKLNDKLATVNKHLKVNRLVLKNKSNRRKNLLKLLLKMILARKLLLILSKI